MNITSKFLIKPTVTDLLGSIRSEGAALGISAISITAEREVDWDFSQPMFDAGLQIVTAARGAERSVIANFIAAIFSSTFLPLVGLILLMILIPAHLVCFFERRHPAGALTHTACFYGIFEACWWSVATLATQADHMPRSAAARIVAVIWTFTSVIFIAYFIATVTSSLTIQ
jgi:polar amino acid transport system substrate-binding protein